MQSSEEQQGSVLREQLSPLNTEERNNLLTDYVREVAGKILDINPENADIHQGLFEMGMNSLMAVGLKSQLEQASGHELPSTLTFNYPTIAELADYLNNLLTPELYLSAGMQPQHDIYVTDATDIDELSEDELENLILKKLNGLK